jgi:Holliday junction resolvasome RuvABC ATP-dependent DNA helicase subunit
MQDASLEDGKRMTRARTDPATDEREFDWSLRPRSLMEFVGQERIRKVLGMSI